jgi:O-antigen/teichoic acid export membrane protein
LRLATTFKTHRVLLTNAGSMVAATATTSLLGVGFWFVAAQHFSEAAVGVAGAAVSALLLLGFIGALGMGTMLMGELPRLQVGWRALLGASLYTSALAGLVLGLAFAVLAPIVSPNLSALDRTLLSVLAFAVGAGLTGTSYVLDQSLVGLLQGGLQLTRNVVFASVKLLALIVIALSVSDPGAAWIYGAWTIGLVAGLIVLRRVRTPDRRESWRPAFDALYRLRRSAASHAAVNLALETADLAMPIVVIMLLTPAENSGFYIAWLIVNLLIMVPYSLSSVAYALGSGEAQRGEERFRFTIALSVAIGVAVNILLLVAAEPVLNIFGSFYAETASGALQVLALGVFPLTIKTHFIAVHRVRRSLGRALPLAWAGTVLELGGGAIGALLGGVEGVAWGWLAGLVIEAIPMSRDVFALKPPRATSQDIFDHQRD